MAHTLVGFHLRRFLRLAALANQPDAPPVATLVQQEQMRLDRRRFLRQSAQGAAALGAMALLPGCSDLLFPVHPTGQAQPRIAIVGGGMAGLHAAYTLQRYGYQATVYEASRRIGGRVFTGRDVMAPGLTTEFGGEFIDSIHADMFALARTFGLELIDAEDDDPSLIALTYMFDGRLWTEEEIITMLQPLADRYVADAARINNDPDAFAFFDQIPLDAYFDRIGATGVIRELLDVAFVTEYGLETKEQTSLNFLWLFPAIRPDGLYIFNISDERYKIKGGNDQIVQRLAEQVTVQTGMRLTALRPQGTGFTLVFGGTEVEADYVVLAIPFSLLRQVDVQVLLPDTLRRFIREVGYGTNAKVMVGFDSRPWRAAGYGGEVFTDRDFQLCWDNSLLQDETSGGITFYSGGKKGLRVNQGSVEAVSDRFVESFEEAFPGAGTQRNGNNVVFHWPSYPFALGSYACFQPGQYSGFAQDWVYIDQSVEGNSVNVGNLYFAGEHHSDDYQGYMNGAAQTGRLAAEALVRVLQVA